MSRRLPFAPTTACWAAALLVALASVAPVRGEGLLFKLPADGASATFDLRFEGKVVPAGLTGELEMSSVGQTEQFGEKGRWLEFRIKLDASPENPIVVKVHVLEKHLRAGERPFDNFSQLWLRRPRGEPRQVKDVADPEVGFMPVLLAGPLNGVEKLEPLAVRSALGETPCAGHKGALKLVDKTAEVDLTIESRLHDDAPFGVTRLRVEFARKPTGADEVETGSLTLTLKAIGKDAVSTLPDIK